MEVDGSLLLGRGQLEQLVTSLLESSEQCPEDMLGEEPHPNDRTLVMFADKIYIKKNSGENDAAYGVRTLSGELYANGWRCLITANNATTSNGYFGAAFYHSGQQQVVVAHRGTVPTCSGAWYTDIIGVFGTRYTPCMNSALTFIDNIRKVIHTANTKPNNRHYTLAITGHSLGAWLAQISAFSVKYLAIKRLDSLILFKKNSGIHAKTVGFDSPDARDIKNSGIHAKTVGFDSPGARDMLNRVLDNHYNRYERNAPRLDGLDISLYLSAPNHINTCGMHIGKIFHILVDMSSFTWIDKNTPKYTLATHAITNFVKALDKNCKISEVLDWASSVEEYKNLFKYNNDECKVDDQFLLEKFYRLVVEEDKSSKNISNSSLSVFSEFELRILNKLQIMREQKIKLSILNDFTINNKLQVESHKLVPDFVIDNYHRTITCESGESLAELCKRLKQLMRWLEPQFTQAVEEQIKVFNRAADLIYYAEGQSYLDSLPKCWLDFRNSVSFQDFLVSSDDRVPCLVTSSKDVVFQMSRLRKILYQMEKSNDSSNSSMKDICQNHYTFLSQSQLQILVKKIGWPIEKKFLMVVDCTLSSLKSIHQLLDEYKKDTKSLKLILIVSQSKDTADSSKNCKTVYIKSDVHFSDLTPASQNEMFNRDNVITIGGIGYSFESFLEEDRSICKINQILSSEYLKKFATNENHTINIDTRSKLSDIQMPYFKLNIKTSMKFFARCMKSPNIMVVVSGLNRKHLETEAYWRHLKEMDVILTERDAQLSFRDTCKKNQDKCIYLFEVLGREVYCKEIFNRNFYLDRKFLHRAYIDVKKFAETEHADDLFVINSESNKKLFVKLIENCRRKQVFTDNILIASTDQEVNVIQKHIKKCIHFVNICPREESYKLEWRYSHGSVKSLLLCISYEPINEIFLSKTERNLTIITDEPGMGKTTTLSSLSRLMDTPWVIYIELKYFQEHIGNKLTGTLTNKIVANFLLSECGSQAEGLLEYLLESKIHSKRVVLMLDGFDELEDYVKDKDKASAKQNIIKLLTFLKNIPTVQIFLTARKYLKRSLEEELCNLCTLFVPFNEEEQLNFLVVIWRSCLSLELGDYGEEEEGRLKEYAGEVLRQAKVVLGPDSECIMGVPLQLRMLAEVFRPTSDLLLYSPEILLNQINVENTSNLYKKFITLKYEIYLRDKTTLGAVVDELIIKHFSESITIMHCKLGFKTLFHDFYVKHFDAIEDRWLNKLNRIGLVQTKGDGNLQFIHRTYAEYCCAEMVVYWLNKRTLHCRYELFKEILFPQILLHPDSKIIRMFMNELLNQRKMAETVFELNTKCIIQLWNEDSSIFRHSRYQTVLHIAVVERHLDIVKLLGEQTAVPFTELMAQRDQWGWTPLYTAVRERGGLDIMKYLVERGADINTRGGEGESVLMCAAWGGELLTIKYLVERGGDIHDTDWLDRTVLQYAAEGGHLPVVEYFLQQGVDPDRVDRRGETALTRASRYKKWDVVRLLLERGVDVNAHGGRALSEAIWWGEWSIVEALINKGAAIKESLIRKNLSEFKVKYPNYEFKNE